MDANPYEPPVVPPEPRKLSVRLERELDRVRIVSAKRQWGIAAFLLLWLTGWTFGCIFLLGAVIAQFSFFMLLFAVPFWAAEFFVAAIVGTMIASREELVLDETGVAYRWTVWGINVKRRYVPLNEIASFASRIQSGGDDNSAIVHRHLVRMNTIGAPLEMGGSQSSEESDYLVQTLSEVLATLKRSHGPVERDAPALPDASQLPPILELRPPSTTSVPAPSDTTWRQHNDFDAITFTQRGTITLAGVGTLLFINLFWNGITSVFAAGLFGFTPDGKQGGFAGMEWWTMFFFLIPFELIGLVMFVGLLATLAEPVRRSRWILHRNAVAYRIGWLGIGRTWRYEISELDRLELRREEKNALESKMADMEDAESATDASSPASHDVPSENSATGATLTLALVDRKGGDVCKIAQLSLGEACWIADVILRERSGWFA